MTRQTQIFEHESLQDADNLAAFLKAIARGIQKGEITFDDEEDQIVLRPHRLGRFRIKVSKSPRNQTLRLKIVWSGEEEGELDDSPLFIDTD